MLGCVQCFLKVTTLHFSESAFGLKSHCMHTNPFNRRTSICCEVGHAMPYSGGLKGKMALGDAHPYLAPFYLS